MVYKTGDREHRTGKQRKVLQMKCSAALPARGTGQAGSTASSTGESARESVNAQRSKSDEAKERAPLQLEYTCHYQICYNRTSCRTDRPTKRPDMGRRWPVHACLGQEPTTQKDAPAAPTLLHMTLFPQATSPCQGGGAGGETCSFSRA